jgi:hypothetical protein
MVAPAPEKKLKESGERKEERKRMRGTEDFLVKEKKKTLTFKPKLYLCPLNLICPKNKNKGVYVQMKRCWLLK